MTAQIVIDLGCMGHEDEVSVEPLLDRFRPNLLYGFDAHPRFTEGVEEVAYSMVVRRRLAAWIYDGNVPLYVGTTSTGVDYDRVEDVERVPCFDLARWLWTLPLGVVLKLDVEGAEYPLLHRIRDLNLDLSLELVIVEWHPETMSHGLYRDRPRLRCPVEEWPR